MGRTGAIGGRPTAAAPACPAPGRDAELARLLAELDSALASRSVRVILVRGARGMGRSALLRSFTDQAETRGVRVFSGRADRRASTPFALLATPISSALDSLAAHLPDSALQSLARRVAPLASEAAELPVDGAFAHLCNGVIDVLFEAGRDRPFALVLDDADAADADSLEVLGRACAALTTPAAVRGPHDPLRGGVVVVGFRDEKLPPALHELIARTPATSVPLTGLDLDALRGWLNSEDAATRLLEATGGVPARLEALLDSPSPLSFASRRVARLPAADRQILAALAVCRIPADAGVVAEVCGRADVDERLRRLESQRFVSTTPAAGRSLHALARDSEATAVLDTLDDGTRIDYGLAAGEAWQRRGDGGAAFESFYEAAATAVASSSATRSAEAVDRALTTGTALVHAFGKRCGFDAAQDILERLLRLPVAPSVRSELQWLLAEQLERRGLTREALAAVGRGRRDTHPADRPKFRARAARLCIVLGALRPAERLARGVLTVLGPELNPKSCDPVREDAALALAEARFLSGAYDEVLEQVASFVSSTSCVHRLALTNVQGKALLMLGRLDDARITFEENAQNAESLGAARERARAVLNSGVALHRGGQRAAAQERYRESLVLDDVTLAPFAHANLASILLEQGAIGDALTESHRALDAFTRLGRVKEQAHSAQNLARAYLYLGDLHRAPEVAEHAATLADRVGDPYLQAGAALVSGEILLALGNLPDAKAKHGPIESTDCMPRQVLARAAESFERLRSPRYHREALLAAVDDALAREAFGEAETLLERAREAGALDVPALASTWHLLLAERALVLRESDDAAAALAEARSALVESPQLESPARLYFLLGRLAEQQGQPEKAAAEFQRAARVLEELSSRVPPERRAVFFSRPDRRRILEAAGALSLELPSQAAAGADARTEEIRPLDADAVDSTAQLVGRSPAIERVRSLVRRVAPATATVLLRGESGTGKELVARALHLASARRDRPFIAVNCGALSEELLLSELFGHEKGAFTGAARERRGRFELAEGGTLFLDEIGDVSPKAQVALLRVLQERAFERLGGTRTVQVDVRVVCATNKPLESGVADGSFREDLYYRLRGVTLHLPPLRERLEDVPLLSEHLLQRIASARGESPKRLSPDVLACFAAYGWPGNIRELANVLESATILSSGNVIDVNALELTPELLDAAAVPAATAAVETGGGTATTGAFVSGGRRSGVADPAVVVGEVKRESIADAAYRWLRHSELSLRDARRAIETECIARALGDAGGNISEAARLLRVKRSRLSELANAEPRLRQMLAGAGSAEGEVTTGNVEDGETGIRVNEDETEASRLQRTRDEDG